MANSHRPLNPLVAAVGDALREIGYYPAIGPAQGAQQFRHESRPWVLLHDDPFARLEDILKHFRARGVDMDAFFAAVEKLMEGVQKD